MPATVHLRVSCPDGNHPSFSITEHDTFLLGRMNDCHLCVPGDTQVSRHHFLLEACPPMVSLRDLGSLNGTYVNGKKFGGRNKGETPEQGALRQYPSIDLKHGDSITVGQSTILIEIEDLPAERMVRAALPEGDLSGLSPEAMRKLIFGSPNQEIFSLANYAIQREIGRGGCGAVYLANSKSGGNPVAVKLMLSRAQADAKAIDHFKREMQVIAGLQHPNIVRFLDSGSDQGTFFFWRTGLRRLELRCLHIPTPHRKIPLPLRPQARSHRHHPQRKPRSHPRTDAVTEQEGCRCDRSSSGAKSEREVFYGWRLSICDHANATHIVNMTELQHHRGRLSAIHRGIEGAGSHRQRYRRPGHPHEAIHLFLFPKHHPSKLATLS